MSKVLFGTLKIIGHDVKMKIPILKVNKYSTQININGELKDEILDFQNNLSEVIEYEKEPHITVLYGIEKLSDKDKINKDKLSGKLGAIKKFEKEDSDVIYIEVISDDLINKNKEISNFVNYSSDYNKYIPHLTLAYVKKGSNDSLLNNNRFLDRLFKDLPLLFCHKNEKKEIV